MSSFHDLSIRLASTFRCGSMDVTYLCCKVGDVFMRFQETDRCFPVGDRVLVYHSDGSKHNENRTETGRTDIEGGTQRAQVEGL